jgi:hypothetical protein
MVLIMRRMLAELSMIMIFRAITHSLENLVSAGKTMQSADVPLILFQRCRQSGTVSIWLRNRLCFLRHLQTKALYV